MEMRSGAHSGTLLHVTCHFEGAFPPCHSEGAERVLNEVKEESHLMGSATERQWWILRFAQDDTERELRTGLKTCPYVCLYKATNSGVIARSRATKQTRIPRRHREGRSPVAISAEADVFAVWRLPRLRLAMTDAQLGEALVPQLHN
jgi:hypothetical protein